MITSKLTHPQIIAALAAAGHGSTVLVADAHFPAATAIGPNAARVHLNLTPGTPSVPEVLSVIIETVSVEDAAMIEPSEDASPCSAQEEIRRALPETLPCRTVKRHEFYEMTRTPDLALCIVTGDDRRFANTLLTLGVTNAGTTG